MKRYGNLYERIISIENLSEADRKARRGKEKNSGVRHFDAHRDALLQELHDKLARGEYHTSRYHTFIIHEPKERVIYRLPYYPDRIVHHAILNVIEPIWVKTFTTDCYACVKERGIHACAHSVRKALDTDKEGTRYCLKLDIRKYYPSIDHDILKDIVRRKIKDKRLISLIDEIIDSADGLPIGNYLSQYLANLYLTYFDHAVKEELKARHYSRYADDMVFLASTKQEAHAIMDYVDCYLGEKLKLTVKPNWRIFPTKQGIDFVGFVFFPTHTAIRKGVKKNLVHKIASLEHRGKTPKKDEYLQAVASWWGWLKYSDSKHLLQTINKRTTYEIKFGL